MFLVTESSKKWIKLTKEQQAYIRFIRDTMNEQWQKTMDVPDHRDPHTKKMMRKYQFSRMNQATLPEDFMPRVGMDQGEFLERHGLIKGLREGTFSKWHKYRSQFLEEYQYVYKNQDLPNGVRLSGAAGKVPIRYIGSEDIIGDQLHTMSAEIAFKKFIDNLITKRELDDIVEWGAGLRTFMTFDANSPDQFKGYSKFVRDQILIQIFGGKQKFQITSKPIVIKTKDKTYTINQDQILRGLKYWSTITSMWLKPIQGTFNHALIIMLDTKDALKGTIARAVGVPPENIDFTMKDLHRAEMEVFKLWKDQALGNQRENKLYNLAYKFQYLTDSYDYTIFRENLVAGGTKLFKESNMYFFHTIGEDHGNYSLLAAQLMHMKHPKTGKSIWDSYDNYGNWNAPSRGVTVDPGTGETTELNELDSREITKLKRVSQRIHGSYRQEERSALELYALGQWLLQFKRYMPQLLNNLFQGGYKDSTAGYYKQVFDANGKPKRIDGEDVFEFSERMQRGRLWVMLEILGSLWGKGRAFNDMDPEEQQQFIDLMMTATLMLSYGTYVMTGYKDDDEKFWSTNFGMRLNRLIVEDLTQNVNPMDAGRNLVTPLITVSKLYNGMQALGSFLVDGLILGNRTQQGRIPGETTVRKYIPVLSMFAEFEKYIGNAQEAGVLEEDGGILDRLQKAAEFSRIR